LQPRWKISQEQVMKQSKSLKETRKYEGGFCVF
jgi:hypothetical protein